MVKRTICERFLSALFPERCCCCGKPVVCGKVVCDKCRPGLKIIEPPVCHICGCNRQHCQCKGRRRHTDRCVAPFYHEGCARSALHRLKFQNKAYVAEMFYLAMSRTVLREYAGIEFDCIVPVPLSKDVLKSRRYNQSLILAHGLSKQLGIQIKQILIKTVTTAPQRELPAYRRSGNVLGVFEVVGDISNGESVLLVDDTITTGSTLNECAKILKMHGARAVYAVTATSTKL